MRDPRWLGPSLFYLYVGPGPCGCIDDMNMMTVDVLSLTVFGSCADDDSVQFMLLRAEGGPAYVDCCRARSMRACGLSDACGCLRVRDGSCVIGRWVIGCVNSASSDSL